MKPPHALTAVLAAVLLATAWAQPLTSQPVEPLLASPLAVTEVTPNSATLALSTTIGLACVVVYGEGDAFGQLALDQNMGGSAHQEHFVVLRGLEPDTEYRYRLQGSDASGTFYASSVMRFRTPSASADAALGENVATLAAGARVLEASSAFGDGFRAEYALDGDPETEWSSRGDGDGAFLTLELPAAVEVTGFGLWSRTMGSSAEIRRFTVENEAGEVYGPFELPDAAGLYSFAAEGRGQRFTFRVLDSSGGNTGIVELAVFARARPR